MYIIQSSTYILILAAHIYVIIYLILFEKDLLDVTIFAPFFENLKKVYSLQKKNRFIMTRSRIYFPRFKHEKRSHFSIALVYFMRESQTNKKKCLFTRF